MTSTQYSPLPADPSWSESERRDWCLELLSQLCGRRTDISLMQHDRYAAQVIAYPNGGLYLWSGWNMHQHRRSAGVVQQLRWKLDVLRHAVIMRVQVYTNGFQATCNQQLIFTCRATPPLVVAQDDADLLPVEDYCVTSYVSDPEKIVQLAYDSAYLPLLNHVFSAFWPQAQTPLIALFAPCMPDGFNVAGPRHNTSMPPAQALTDVFVPAAAPGSALAPAGHAARRALSTRDAIVTDTPETPE